MQTIWCSSSGASHWTGTVNESAWVSLSRCIQAFRIFLDTARLSRKLTHFLESRRTSRALFIAPLPPPECHGTNFINGNRARVFRSAYLATGLDLPVAQHRPHGEGPLRQGHSILPTTTTDVTLNNLLHLSGSVRLQVRGPVLRTMQPLPSTSKMDRPFASALTRLLTPVPLEK
jgi:hypothetical protein